MMSKLILTSYGLTNSIGRKQIRKAFGECNLTSDDLADKKIFLFHGPYCSIESTLVEECENLGFQKGNIILSGQHRNNQEVLNCDFYYCTEGNTFEILSMLREQGLDCAIRNGFFQGNKFYIGCSAGAAIAGSSIEQILDFDRNFVRMQDFSGLGLFDGIIIPHYTKAELKHYIDNSPGIEQKYKKIYSVKNDGCKILEIPCGKMR